MQAARRAVIDVGTNSVKLLVGDVVAPHVRPVHEESQQTRLGQGFYETHRLQPRAIAKTVEAVSRFADQARLQNATCIKVIATSAVRDAVNAAELLAAIEDGCGLKVEVISGEREADWAFGGATTEPSLAAAPLFIADVGGGSAQFILGRGEHKVFSRSCPLGTVRLLEKLPHSDPPQRDELMRCREWVAQFLQKELKPDLDLFLLRERGPVSESSGTEQNELQFVGTGGTASILGCMESGLDHFDRRRLEETRISSERLRWHTVNLWSLSLEARKRIVGLPPNRADVILTGAVIYETVANVFGFRELRISTRGLRFAALLEG